MDGSLELMAWEADVVFRGCDEITREGEGSDDSRQWMREARATMTDDVEELGKDDRPGHCAVTEAVE